MLVLNSGSTSMKIALYREEAEVFSATENYDHKVLDRCGSICAKSHGRARLLHG